MSKHGPRETMERLVGLYLDRRSSQVSPLTLRQHGYMLARLAEWFDGQRPKRVPKSLTAPDLERYVWGKHTCVKACKSPQAHAGAGLRYTMAAGAFNKQRIVLKGFLTWASRHGHLDARLLDVVEQGIPTRKKRKVRLSPAQLGDLITGCPDPWTRAVCALATFTAGRGGELLTVRVGDVDLDRGLIDWSRHKTGDDADSLPITSDLADELDRWFDHYERSIGRSLDGDDYLIPRRTSDGSGKPGHYQYHPTQRRGDNLHKVVKPELARALGVPESELMQQGVHTLRRSMARALYERLRDENHGDPLGVVQALLGHQNRQMTEHYIGVESGREARDSVLRGRSMFG